MFQATRRRLALWYTLVTAVLLLLFASGVYFYVRQTLVERIDDTLKHVVEVVNRSLVVQGLDQAEYGLNVSASFRDNDASVDDDHIDLEWFSAEGRLLWSTMGNNSPLSLASQSKTETVSFSGDRQLRQVTKRIQEGGMVLGYLRVSHPWFEVTKPIQQLAWDLSLGLTILVSSAAAIGWFLSGLAMEPIAESYQSLKQFTADASHELRNPIAVIQTNVQQALEYPEADPQQQRQQLQVIERLTQRLGNLVNDLLFLARSDSGTLGRTWQTIPLDALLIEVIEEQRLTAEQRGIFLSLRIESRGEELEEDFTVQGDWDQLARLFTNLITNAFDHSRPREQTEPSVALTLEHCTADHGALRPRQSGLQVTVADNGVGIDPEQIPHLFDRFFRADPSRSPNQGVGLGLAIVAAIVQHHQGKISVTSSPQGSQFRVQLPSAAPLG
ncbi:sensory transduction histidine kinase [Synechocystis sp. PCC 6803]|jgi:OmpR-family two-component system manganese-sensing sensor histidine kinase|uniref:histidine kinase n=1 Tax=Synechocystis sp. (strain ATCC 27184 / PCC 6803 / Kazusa) TaxID=1111708 RepID=Q55718_SYNY3|nr:MULTISPECIES: HAMP domain-containing sensor histidine kinase [unclassified Synechocystis]BAM54051.1 sensory transduction histidine kinase [Synechocystis sp. PCC 6803] [Bacillus subtilis BEST7613]AGF52651.1 sensory transduction histidine kinase [Synechocystis sp. PCC 6803]ALJ68576.1 histidine kinase [Synechocystis sp. PCC 6803]AVP90421.1 sensor histidine kinase [Synechocystis sp. IPPAS B-1465]MBD2616839.1 HAMP domain-containing histidine kinase [Synechocystis sp. FACHB-898]